MRGLKRKNGALNAAANGLERGISRGLGIGMQARQADDQREEALGRAKRAEEALNMEKEDRARASSLRDANASASDEIAGAYEDDVSKNIKAIGHEIVRQGGTLEHVGTVFKTLASRKKQLEDEQARKSAIDELSMATKEGKLFGTALDGTKVESPEIEKSLATLQKAIDSGADAKSIQSHLHGLQRAQMQSEADLKSRQNFLTFMDGQVANVVADYAANEKGNPRALMANYNQLKEMGLMREGFAQFGHLITADKEKFAAFNQKFQDIANGIAYRSRDGEAHSFESADVAKERDRALARITDMESEFAQYKADREAKNIENDATRAQAAKTSAEASMLRANQRPPARPIPDTSVADYSKIAEIVDSRLLSDETYKSLGSDTEKAAYRANKMTEERNAARTLSDQNNQDRAALGNRKGKGDDARKREEDAIANPQNYPDMTAEEFDHFVETGELPKKK